MERLWEQIGSSPVLAPLVYAGGFARTLQVVNIAHGGLVLVGWVLEASKVTVLAIWS
jgi:hypothetical protein